MLELSISEGRGTVATGWLTWSFQRSTALTAHFIELTHLYTGNKCELYFLLNRLKVRHSRLDSVQKIQLHLLRHANINTTSTSPIAD